MIRPVWLRSQLLLRDACWRAIRCIARTPALSYSLYPSGEVGSLVGIGSIERGQVRTITFLTDNHLSARCGTLRFRKPVNVLILCIGVRSSDRGVHQALVVSYVAFLIGRQLARLC